MGEPVKVDDIATPLGLAALRAARDRWAATVEELIGLRDRVAGHLADIQRNVDTARQQLALIDQRLAEEPAAQQVTAQPSAAVATITPAPEMERARGIVDEYRLDLVRKITGVDAAVLQGDEKAAGARPAVPRENGEEPVPPQPAATVPASDSAPAAEQPKNEEAAATPPVAWAGPVDGGPAGHVPDDPYRPR